MDQELTFDKLPKAVTTLLNKVTRLEALLTKRQEQPPTEPPERKYDVQGAADFLGISPATVYTKVSRGELPVCKAPKSKRLFFFENDLTDYLKSGRKKTNTEIKTEAEAYLPTRKK